MACEQHCDNCRWSRRAERAEEVVPAVVTVRRVRLECRAEPPTRAGFPEVEPGDWCGEWQARL